MNAKSLSLVLVASLTSAGCELTKQSLVEPLPNVVVEAFVRVQPEGGGTVFALFHGSVGVPSASPDGPEAQVWVHSPAGSTIELTESDPTVCAWEEGPGPDPRRCYAADLPTTFVHPRDRLTFEARLTGGGTIEGGTVVPGAFAWAGPAGAAGASCAVGTGAVTLGWTPSDGTWAYIADMMLHGVEGALLDQGVVNPSDSVALFGVTVSRADTSIAFPEDFTVDEDVDYELPLAAVLEAGLQPGMAARASVIAIDRNFTNWVRDQVFNPSGTVRIPSLRGDGTGVFGSSVALERWVAGDAIGCESYSAGVP